MVLGKSLHLSEFAFNFLKNVGEEEEMSSTVGEEQTYLYPQGSSGRSSNQIDIRQINMRK